MGFRETKMRNGGRVLLSVLNLCVRIKIPVATLGTNHSFTDFTHSIAASVQKFPVSVKSVSRARHRQSMCQAKQSAYQSV
jgi:hypothetical protein